VLGVVVNRLNVSLVGTYAYTGSRYLPSFRELSVSVFLVMVGVIVFGLAIKYLRIFDIHDHSGGAAAEPLPEPAHANSGAAL
jgi:Ni/Fe-hydrogenase subunit HybB-like protein